MLINHVYAGDKHTAQGMAGYKTIWQDCQYASDCVAVSAGYNWTCVNSQYEKDARSFCRSVDGKGTAQCYQVGLDGGITNYVEPSPQMPKPVCSQGKCYCEDIGSWVGGREDACVKDQDCVVEKFLTWRSVNPKINNLIIEPYYGAACSETYRYPPPQAFCFNGKCKIGDSKPKE